MPPGLLGEALVELLMLLLVSASLFLALGRYVRHRSPHWILPLERHRIRVLFALSAAVLALKVSATVLFGDPGPVDEALMHGIRALVPPQWLGAFTTITNSGSTAVLAPMTALLVALLWLAGRRYEAGLLGGSMACGWLLVYVVKHAVGRDRPALWETDWYWGSSFPSGHTLSTAVFATAAVLIARRMWPASRPYVVTLAASWITAVAASRLVLGVHWPTDVLAAAAIGSFLPLLLAAILRVLQHRLSQ